jgi:CelD/BcsL family acetyltransferase involved in cellulose biosynthesis
MLQAKAGQNTDAVARERDADDLTPDFIAEWAALADEASEPNAFAEHWFMGPALAWLRSGIVKLIEVRALSGELIGIMPLERDGQYGRMPVQHIRNWVHFQCFMSTPLVRMGCEDAFWTALLRWLDDSEWARGFLTLREVDADGPVIKGLMAVRSAAVVHNYRRAVLQSDLSADAYLAQRLSGKKRKELRRLDSRLAETGQVSFTRLTDSAQLPAWTEAFLALEAAGWKGQDGAALANHAGTAAFLEAMLTGAMAAGRLDFQRLAVDDRAIAMLINFRTPPMSWSFKIAYDESLARFSPGVMIELENLKAVLGDPAITMMDSCAVEDHPMIDRLWSERRTIAQVTVPLRGLRRRTIHALCRSAESASAIVKRVRT